MIKRFRKNKKGGVLVEFAMGALLFFSVFFTAIEWSLEIFVRHSVERGLAASLFVYGINDDPVAAREAAISETGGLLAICLEPIEIRLFDSISGIDLSSDASGYARTGTAADDNAAFVRMTLTCVWPRFTPIVAGILGSEMAHEVTGFTSARWQP